MKTPILSTILAVTILSPSALRAGWAEDTIRKECDYIVDCSFTTHAQNNSLVQTTDAAHGAINVVRIYTKGPDWVNPGESAMAMVGLMAGAKRLKSSGVNISVYEQVLDKFFNDWVVGSGSGLWETTAGNPNYGGARSRVYYTTGGAYSSADPANAGVTGQMVCAMWKYYEFLKNVGRNADATAWLAASSATAQRAGDFLNASMNSTYNMCGSRPGLKSTGDLWTVDSVWCHVAFRSLARYKALGSISSTLDYSGKAGLLRTAIQAMQDSGAIHNFFRFRKASAGYAPTYGDLIDQLCFLPYEANVLPMNQAFCGQVSDWWSVEMTPQTNDPADWRYFGTIWKWIFAGAPENDYLYPGPGLQLAKVEWKHYKATGNTGYLDRAAARFQFAHNVAYSGLWFGATGEMEANVPNGIVDWRSAVDENLTAEPWARFCDTSAYLIQLVLMISFNSDVNYQPVL